MDKPEIKIVYFNYEDEKKFMTIKYFFETIFKRYDESFMYDYELGLCFSCTSKNYNFESDENFQVEEFSNVIKINDNNIRDLLSIEKNNDFNFTYEDFKLSLYNNIQNNISSYFSISGFEIYLKKINQILSKFLLDDDHMKLLKAIDICKNLTGILDDNDDGGENTSDKDVDEICHLLRSKSKVETNISIERFLSSLWFIDNQNVDEYDSEHISLLSYIRVVKIYKELYSENKDITDFNYYLNKLDVYSKRLFK